jgi:leucyl aminopeptidase
MKIEVITKKSKEQFEIAFWDNDYTNIDSAKKKLFVPKLKNKDDLRSRIGFVRNIVRNAKKYKLAKIAIDLKQLTSVLGIVNAQMLSENFLMANYEFDTLKTKKDDFKIKEIGLLGKVDIDFMASLKTGVKIGKQVNEAREFSNLPGNIVNPDTVEEYVVEMFKDNKRVSLKIFNKSDLVDMEAGGLLAVGGGSQHEPRLIVLEYFGSSETQTAKVMVGKTVTHDNGGMNLKPSAGGSLEEMHMDMSGGSAVLHAFKAIVDLGLKQNVVAVLPVVENSMSGSAYRTGDIIRSLSGKTIEVLNTDAEGRIILADAFTYAQQNYKPEWIVDVATLTGAIIIALGNSASGLMSNNQEFANKVLDKGNNVTGDFMWQLPLWADYNKATRNKRADVGNIPESNSRAGGSINAAIFLKEFIDPKNAWAHIDMASRMTNTESDNLGKGAMGETVRLLVELARS